MEENLTQMAYRKLKQMIMNYQLIPGQRLILSDLAGQLGVSRTPVNNALSILANEGFLDFVHNQGYKVHHINKTEAESLYEIFEIIALGSVGQAIRKLSPLKLANLDEKKKAYEQAVTERVTRGRFFLDQEFHASHIHMSENLYLADYFREVYQRIFLRHGLEGLRTERASAVVKEHNEIFAAISLRDVEGAKDAIKYHINAGKQYIFSVIF